jgi:glycosyltransferase involved in cell wall biosynthesis
MRVQIVDPSAFTPPYDHALCAALARAGAQVELVTSHFLYGPVPDPEGYEVSEVFYSRASKRGLTAPGRRAFKLAEHLGDMLRFRRRETDAELDHYQWLTVPSLDRRLLPNGRPRVYTAHHVVHRGAGRGERRRAKRLLESFDAVIAHSEYGAKRIREEAGASPDILKVIPHGALDYLTRVDASPLPDELAETSAPVVLAFGLIRDYKGTDVLLRAFRDIEDAELWIVGMPRMPMEPLYQLASECKGTVRFVPRFITDTEIPSYFRRADLVVLPYTDAEHSGVLYTGLAFGKPMLLSAVGGFPEIAEEGAARLVPPGDDAALEAALRELLGDDAERARLGDAAEQAAAGRYSWDSVAVQTMALYRELLG